MVRKFVWVLVALLAFSVMPGTVAANEVQEEIAQNYEAIRQLARERQYPEMLQLIRRNQELEPRNFNHFLQEAYAYSQWYAVVRREEGLEASLPYYRQAIMAFQRAAQVAESNHADPVYVANIYYDQGYLAFDVRDTNTARRAATRALALFPNGVRYNHLMGRALLYEEGTQNIYSERMKYHYYIAAKNNSETRYFIPDAYFWAASYAYDNNRIDEAREILEEGLSIVDSHDGIPSQEYTLIGEREEYQLSYIQNLRIALDELRSSQ